VSGNIGDPTPERYEETHGNSITAERRRPASPFGPGPQAHSRPEGPQAALGGVRKQGELLVPILEALGEGSGGAAEGGFAQSAVGLTSSGALASIASIVPRPLVFRA